jgi:hypothetical protein
MVRSSCALWTGYWTGLSLIVLNLDPEVGRYAAFSWNRMPLNFRDQPRYPGLIQWISRSTDSSAFALRICGGGIGRSALQHLADFFFERLAAERFLDKIHPLIQHTVVRDHICRVSRHVKNFDPIPLRGNVLIQGFAVDVRKHYIRQEEMNRSGVLIQAIQCFCSILGCQHLIPRFGQEPHAKISDLLLIFHQQDRF